MLGIAVAMSFVRPAEPRQCRPSGRIRSTAETLAAASGRRVSLAACTDTCVVRIAMCRREHACANLLIPERCGRAQQVQLAAPPSGAKRRVLFLRDGSDDRRTTRAVVTCRHADRTACLALAFPDDAVYDLAGYPNAPTAVARLRRTETGAAELTLRPSLFDTFTLKGFADPDGLLQLAGEAVFGDAAIPVEAALSMIPGTLGLAGPLRIAGGTPTQIELVAPIPGRGVGSPLVLVLDLQNADDGPSLTATVDLPVSLAPSGVASVGPADVSSGGATLAHVGSGECLISPASRISCVLPWDEGETSSYLWLQGMLTEPEVFLQNQVAVGAPPSIVRTGTWRSR